MNMFRPLYSMLSPGGAKARLSVFIFHRVLPHPDPIFPSEVDARGFDEMLGWIGQWFNVLPLDEAVARLKSDSLPRRAAAISFDDGYADNYTVALPILQRHGMPATFFIATGFLDGGRMWNDTIIESLRGCTMDALDLSALGLGTHSLGDTLQRRAAILQVIPKVKYLPGDQRLDVTERLAQLAGVEPPADLMMTSDQVRAMRQAGMQVGAHTVTHPILAREALDVARQEIGDSRDVLQSLLGEKVGLFAYPNGKPGTDYLPAHPQLVKEMGFDAAVSTAWGAGNRETDLFQIPRFTPWDRSRLRFGVRLARNFLA